MKRPKQYAYETREIQVRVPVKRRGILSYEEQLAENIREARIAAGWSQHALAEAVGLSRTSIVNIETYRQTVMIANLYAIARALHCDVRQLLPAGKWEVRA